MISLVIPTMWKAKSFTEALEYYSRCCSVSQIIVIDNNPKLRPSIPSTVELLNMGYNRYVNPAWNLGVTKSSQPVVCLLNDDIVVNSSVFDLVTTLDFHMIDLLGVRLIGTKDNFQIDHSAVTKDGVQPLQINRSHAIGGQSWAFGICMFLQRTRYPPIPSLYKIWFGDDYLVQKLPKVYALETSGIQGKISETISNLSTNPVIRERIALDTKNANRYLFRGVH